VTPSPERASLPRPNSSSRAPRRVADTLACDWLLVVFQMPGTLMQWDFRPQMVCSVLERLHVNGAGRGSETNTTRSDSFCDWVIPASRLLKAGIELGLEAQTT
jgi:hypothetical protein